MNTQDNGILFVTGWIITVLTCLALICFGFWLHFKGLEWQIKKTVKQECLIETTK